MKQKLAWTNRPQRITGVLGALVLLALVLTGCSQGQLSEEKETFKGNQMGYEFSLPEDWTLVEDYQSEFNQAAVFGAEDSQSTARMFIRVQAEAGLTAKTLAETTAKKLEELYSVQGKMNSTAFEVGDWPAVYYLAESTYQKRKVWVHLYYVATETSVVEFQFYSPDDRSDDKRNALYKQSVQSLVETGAVETPEPAETTSSGAVDPTNGLGTFTNDEGTLALAGYMQVDWTDEEQLLLLRFTYTNNGSEKESPVDHWTSGLTVTAGGEALTVASAETLAKEGDLDDEVQELLEAGTEDVAAGATAEAVVAYVLPASLSKKELLLQPDATHYPEKDAIGLGSK